MSLALSRLLKLLNLSLISLLLFGCNSEGGFSDNSLRVVSVQVSSTLVLTRGRTKVSMPKGNNEQLTATAIYSDGSTADVSSSATWNNSAPTHMTIRRGRVESLGIGTSIISATHQNVTSNELEYSVTAAELALIQVTPPINSIPKGRTVQLTATGIYTNFTTANISNQVVWSSGNTSVATVDANGLATGTNLGLAGIKASSGPIQSLPVTVQVTSAVLDSIQVTPPLPSVPLGVDQQLIAIGNYSDSTNVDLTNSVTWFSSDSAVVGVNGSGFAESLATGNSSISASLSGVNSNTVNMSVTSAVLTIIQITPAIPSVSR